MNAGVWIVLIIVAAILATPKPLRWTLKRLGPVLLLALCVFGLLFFYRNTSYMTVSITADGKKNEIADAGEVWLKQVIVDGKAYQASDLFSEGWIREDGYLKWRRYDQIKDMKNTITGMIPAGKTVTFIFDSCKWRGIAEVRTEDGSYTVDTYNPTDKARSKTVSLEFPGKANAFRADEHAILLGVVIAVTTLGLVSMAWTTLLRRKNNGGQGPEPLPMKKREVWLDCLKIISALAIILIHTVSSGFSPAFGSDKWFPFTVLNVLPRFAVPVFMMASGVLLLGKEIQLNTAIKKAGKACVLLLFWNLAFLLLNEALRGPSDNVFRLVLSIPVKRQFSGHLWYAYFLVWMYLFSPILSALYQALAQKQLAFLTVIALLLPGVLDLYKNYTGLGGADILPSFYLYMSFSYAAMMLLGRMLYDYLDKIKHPALWGLFLAAIGFGMMMLLTMSYSAKIGKASGDLFFAENKLFAVTMGVGVFLLLASLRHSLQQLPKGLRGVIEFISARSLGIYFFHVVPLWTLGSITVGSAVIDKAASPGKTLLICLIAYIISVYCVSMMSKVPLLKKTVM